MAHFTHFINTLKDELGYKSLDLFHEYLKNEGLDCNYQDFNCMATEETKPSQNLIDTLLAILDVDKKDQLIKLYCEIIFPRNYQKTTPENVRFLKQKVQFDLNEQQIGELAKSKIHYYLFLILVLKAEKIKSSLLKKQFGNLDTFDTVINDLVRSQILIEHNNYIYSASPNIKFPSASNDKVKKFYQQFDDWDKDFSNSFNYEKLLEKTIIRRVSERHLPLIQKQIENVFDTIRTSETSQILRDQEPIVFLQLNFSKGK